MADKVNRKPKLKCVPFSTRDKDGSLFSSGFMCFRGKSQEVCGWCKELADGYCDFVTGSRSATCSNHICEKCSHTVRNIKGIVVAGVDVCPDHYGVSGRFKNDSTGKVFINFELSEELRREKQIRLKNSEIERKESEE